jgi:conserved domain protein
MEQAWKFYGKIKRAFSLTFAKSNEKSLFLHLICAFSQIILQFAYFSGIIVMYHQRIGYGGDRMSISYNKLWKLLIDKGMMKKDLMAATNITASTMAKMGKNEPVSLEILMRICKALNCNIGEIIDIIL